MTSRENPDNGSPAAWIAAILVIVGFAVAAHFSWKDPPNPELQPVHRSALKAYIKDGK